ncbi:uncharacterized protein L201_002136 [Kwoniella dendrophila CBS 6074]|uniref:Uncharacterized protein n=1 Tax=Kwoniella dendrophila CBS 6074 TaxID=1295534 RepID=A0AAX4JQS7_9TREE
MSILSTLASFQAPITLLLIIFGPSLLPRIFNFFRRKPPSLIPTPPSVPKPLSLKLILGIHTLWILKQLVVPPINLFSTYNLPISVSNAQIRYTLLGPENDQIKNLHPMAELLLTRLKIMDSRLLYLRLGHKPLMECMWCQTELDYLIYSLPDILSKYIMEAIFLGLLGWTWIAGQQASQRANNFRSPFGWTLAAAASLECGAKWIWDLRVVEGDATHLASIIHTLRSISLLLFPLIYTFAPLPSAEISPDVLAPIISNTTSTLRLTSLARSAIQRSPRLRETWNMIGRQDAEHSEIAKRDEEVRRFIKDLDIDESTMRYNAGNWVKEGWDGMVRVDPTPK